MVSYVLLINPFQVDSSKSIFPQFNGVRRYLKFVFMIRKLMKTLAFLPADHSAAGGKVREVVFRKLVLPQSIFAREKKKRPSSILSLPSL